MKLLVLAIATLAVLQGYVEPKNATSAGTTATTTAKLTPSTLTTAAKARQHPPTKATATTKKAPAAGGTPTKPAGSDREARGKRTLELGNYNGNYNYYQTVPAHTAQRRVSHAYQDPGQYSNFQSNYIQPQFSFGPAPSGTVGGSLGTYQGFEPQLDGTNSIGSFQSLPPQIHTRYIEPPEPIIEIIIKESNDSLPLDTQSLFPKQKKKKEEVQVFYVKYHKDEKNGQLVLDDPLPAIKPIPDESEEEEDPSQEPIIVTPSPPLKTTTLRAIINPDSEKYHSNSGIRISFGVEDKHQSGHQLSETESESVAQPVVALPQPAPAHRAKSDVFFQQHQQFVQQQQDRSVRQQYPQQQHYNVVPQPQHQHHYQPQPQPQQQHHHQQQHQQQQVHHHQQHLPQAQPLVQQPHQHFSPATPPPFRPQPPPPQPQSQPQQPHQHFQQHYQHQYQQQPQPQPQRVIYNQPQPQPQYQFRGQFQQQAQPQQQQQQYFTQPAPVPQPRPQPPPQQQVRFPPPQQQPQPNFYQPQQQPQFPRNQEYQQPKPIPIPLHNINQQPPLRQQYAPQPQQPQQQQFNQPFNFYKQQQQQQQPQPQPQQPTPQPQFRKATPSPPAIVQQPPFAAQRQPVQAPSATYQQQNFDTRGAFVGGLVQQAAPNLGPTRAPQDQKPSFGLSDSEHLSNLKHVLPAGGELVPSVSKYEKHITETINGPVESQQPRQQQQQQQPSFNRQQPFYNIQPSQELISHSIAPQIETIPNKLPTPQRYVSQQAAEIIPNSEPLRKQQQVDPRFNYAAQEATGAQGFDASVSTPSTTVGTSRTTYSPTFSTTPRTTVSQYPSTSPATTRQTASTTRAPPVTAARSAAEEAEANAKKQKALFDLPDEVPDDLREQLLSSGILDNADISVLDYDKLGETDLQSLPPEHLANFFNAGGGAQLAGSSNVLSVVSPNGDKLAEKFISKNYEVKDKRDERDRYEIANGGDEQDQHQQQHQQQDGDEEAEEEEEPTIVTMPERQNVDLKVVRFDSNNQKNVTDRYIKQDSTILPSVDVTREADSAAGTQTEQIFNRYLPLKINGAQFPIPDVVELRGRRIASVVVLAPVDQPQQSSSKSGESASSGSEEGNDGAGFLINADDEETDGTDEQQSRFERDVLLDSKKIKFIAGEALKQLIKKPSRDNFRRWLEREGKTEVDLQSVVLLVTRNDYNEQEIFMYDIATKGVTHLSGELSAAFVQVAEENAKTQNLDEMPIVDSGIVEQMETRSSTEAVDYVTASFGSSSSEDEQDEQAEASERKAVYVYPENYRGLEVNSGYSHIKK